MDYTIDHERGEMTLTLGETKFSMVISHKAMRKIAQDLGETESETAWRLVERSKVGAIHLASIIARSSGAEDLDEVGDAVLREGIHNVLPPIAEFFTMAIRGFRPPVHSKKKAEKRATRSDA